MDGIFGFESDFFSALSQGFASFTGMGFLDLKSRTLLFFHMDENFGFNQIFFQAYPRDLFFSQG